MAKYTGADFVVTFDDSNGDPQNMSGYITEFSGFSIEAILEEAHTFGDSWVEQLFAGLKRAADITISGFYDDTASTGPDAIFNGLPASVASATRTLTVTWGGGKTTEVETYIKSYSRTPSRGAITKYQVVLVPTGTVTEA